MQDEVQISSDQDKLFTTYLWLLSISSFYFVNFLASFVRQIPFGKGIAGMFMMISEIILIVLAIRTYKNYYAELNPLPRIIIILTIIYNVAHIIFSIFFADEVAYLSFFGNPMHQPVFMLPFAFMVGLNAERFGILYKCVWYNVWLMVPIYLLTRFAEPFAGMGLLYLLSFALYLPRNKRIFILVFTVLYCLLCYYGDARAAVIRAIMGGAILMFSYTKFYKSFFVKLILFLAIISLPLYFLTLFIRTGYSVFEHSAITSYVSDLNVEHAADTRTFLYQELFEDLTDNKAWIFGKGITGTYHSEYFDDKYSDVIAERFVVEVGWLFCLLKGGLIQTILYMILLVVASYRCMFRSNNRFLVLLGLILLSHYILLFVEELPRYEVYNIAMWVYIGMAFVLTSDDEYDEDWCVEQFNTMFLKS